jgi:hypothetical protein
MTASAQDTNKMFNSLMTITTQGPGKG